MLPKTPDFWQSRGWQSRLLLPLSALYRLGGHLHRLWAGRKPYHPGIPTLSVGNITVGGTGKTPLVAALAEQFSGQGRRVAVILRGYGGSVAGPYPVSSDDTAQNVGDEALMLRRSLPETVAVWVGKNRVEATKAAEAAGATLLLLDDAFQHWRLARDADVVVVDGHTGLGNGLLLPAGPLREPGSSLKRADFIVTMGGATATHDEKHRFSFAPLLNREDVAALKGKKLLAFAGIGRPQKFFDALAAAGLEVEGARPFPDHAPYTKAMQDALCALAEATGLSLVTTAKDAARLPENFPARVVRLEIPESELAPLTAAITKKLGLTND